VLGQAAGAAEALQADGARVPPGRPAGPALECATGPSWWHLRTAAKGQVHSLMAKLGILPPQAEMFGPTGQVLLDEMGFPGIYTHGRA
jgi:hypothetical protein